MSSPSDRSVLEVLVGLPGSGKSTRAALAAKQGAVVCSTDYFIEMWASDLHKTYDEVFNDCYGEAYRNMLSRFDKAVTANREICWDQTNLSSEKRLNLLSRIPDHYRKICYCIIPPRTLAEKQELVRRLVSREGKTITPEIIERMEKSYVEPTLDEGFDHIIFADLFGAVERVLAA